MSAHVSITPAFEAGDVRAGHSWIAKNGMITATVDMGAVYIAVGTTEEADALIAAFTEAKANLIRLEAERKAAQGGEA